MFKKAMILTTLGVMALTVNGFGQGEKKAAA